MAYKNETDIYQIGSIGAGQYISETDEERSAQIIETQMMGAIGAHSGGHGVLNVGTFSSVDNGGGNFDIVLSGSPTSEGFIHLIYFRTKSTLTWNISGSGVHSLYVRLVESSEFSSREFGDVIIESTTDGIIPDDGLLIAEATISGITLSSLDTDPEDKIEIATIAQHVATSVNPHTTLLEQDQMVISGLTVETMQARIVEFTDELIVSGITTFDGEIQLNNDLDVTGDLVVSGNSLFLGPVKVSGISLFSKAVFSELDVTSGADFRSRIRFFEDIELNSGVTVDTRDIGEDGIVLDDHAFGISAFLNPHNVTAAQVSGIPVTGSAGGGPLLRGNLEAESGISIDGIDISTLKFLIDGSNADPGGGLGHTHDMSGIQEQFIALSPEYPGSVLSGVGNVIVSTAFNDQLTLYDVSPTELGKQSFAIIARVGVPADFKQWPESGISFTHGVDSVADADNFLEFKVRDTSNALVTVPNPFLNSALPTETTLITDGFNSGTFDPGKFFTVIIETNSSSGVSGNFSAYAGDLVMTYETVFKP